MSKNFRLPEHRRLPRKSRTKYSMEIIMEDIGKVYGHKGSKIGNDEIFVRLKFRARKYKGGFGWDCDRNQTHVYSVREQKHKWFRFGWLFYCWRNENEPLYGPPFKLQK